MVVVVGGGLESEFSVHLWSKVVQMHCNELYLSEYMFGKSKGGHFNQARQS